MATLNSKGTVRRLAIRAVAIATVPVTILASFSLVAYAQMLRDLDFPLHVNAAAVRREGIAVEARIWAIILLGSLGLSILSILALRFRALQASPFYRGLVLAGMVVLFLLSPQFVDTMVQATKPPDLWVDLGAIQLWAPVFSAILASALFLYPLHRASSEPLP